MGKRKERSVEEQERRAKIRELLQLSGVSSMEDIQSLFKETIAEFMEDGLEAELTEEPGYSRYDYKNKETENSRNGYSSKKLRTSYGEVDVSIPRDRKGEFGAAAAEEEPEQHQPGYRREDSAHVCKKA